MLFRLRSSFVFDPASDTVRLADVPHCGYFGEPNLGSSLDAFVEYVAPEQVRAVSNWLAHPPLRVFTAFSGCRRAAPAARPTTVQTCTA